MSLTVQQLLSDAKRLTARLRDHDNAADSIITSAQDVLKEVEAMRQYQEDIDSLNTIAHNRPRAQLVLGIQQENRHIRQLQHENKELRASLEEHQNVLELIMKKYRQHMTCLIHSTKIEKDMLKQEKSKVLQERADKICEMANVMQKSIQIDEENIQKEQEMLARLITENKGLRELLEISHRNGSYANPLIGPRLVSTSCQTEEVANNGPYVSETASGGVRECGSKSVASIEAEALSLKPILSSPSAASASTTSTSPRSSSSSLIMNGAIQREEALSPQRPLSSASEESESSISEDDEISFNTIRRKVRPPLPSFCDEAEKNASKRAVTNSTSEIVAVVVKDETSARETTNDQTLIAVIQNNDDHLVNGAVLAEAVKEDNNNGLSHHHDNTDDNHGVKEPNAEGDEVSTSNVAVKKFSSSNDNISSSSNSNEAIIETAST